MKKLLLSVSIMFIAFLFMPKDIRADYDFEAQQSSILSSLDSNAYIDIKYENDFIYIEAKNDKSFDYLASAVAVKSKELGVDNSKIEIIKPIVYTNDELENARDRLLINAYGLNICKVEVDNDYNAVICSFWKDEYSEDMDILQEVSEISHIIKEEIKMPNEALTNVNDNSIYADPFKIPDENDKQLYIDAGRILQNAKALDVDGVLVNDNTIHVAILNMTDEKKAAVQAMAKDSDKLNLISKKSPTIIPKAFSFHLQADNGYAAYKGTLIKLSHKPFMKNGYIMLPIREVCQLLNENSKYEYTLNWHNTPDKLITIKNTFLNAALTISVDKNIITNITHYQDSILPNGQFQAIEGSAEIIDGTVYLPYSPKNFVYIFYAPTMNSDTNILTIEI